MWHERHLSFQVQPLRDPKIQQTHTQAGRWCFLKTVNRKAKLTPVTSQVMLGWFDDYAKSERITIYHNLI